MSTVQVEKFMGTGQMAALLSVSPETLRDAVNRGAVPALRVGRVLRFKPSEVIKAFTQNTRAE